jgi:GNAT superfamily N-acetyltransferase
MTDSIQTIHCTGASLDRYIPELARLRIEVFRGWPYLRDGDADDEARYLRTYSEAQGGVVIVALDSGKVIGAATAVPMAEKTAEVKRPFEQTGIDPATVFYLGESVLLAAYRGRGVGVRFFAEREAHARRLKPFDWFAFCAVERDNDDPRQPADYMPLNAFWNRRGYIRHPELCTEFSWRGVGEGAASPQPMVFWLKPGPGRAI